MSGTTRVTLYYLGLFGIPVCREFPSRERAEQWARQAGVFGRCMYQETTCP